MKYLQTPVEGEKIFFRRPVEKLPSKIPLDFLRELAIFLLSMIRIGTEKIVFAG